MIEYAIFIFCLIGCGITCHRLGEQQGMSAVIQHLAETGQIELDDE
jgi:hypothetical protein|tara:strand:+ start:102 stop:239 length:138 start_codon:yes stop_codon:yes gene_type:complete